MKSPSHSNRLISSPSTFRLRVFGWHCAISAVAVALALSAIFLVWYPPPLAGLQAVFGIAAIIAIVDLGVGPVCTLIVASPAKSRAHLARDLAAIALVQSAALGYGLHAAFTARPAFVVYNVDRFDVVSAKDLGKEQLAQAKEARFGELPWFGPVYVEAVLPADPSERRDILFSAVQGGADVKDLPRYYTDWPAPQSLAHQRQKDIVALADAPSLLERVRQTLRKAGLAEEEASFVPLIGRVGEGVVVLRRSDLKIIGIVPRS